MKMILGLLSLALSLSSMASSGETKTFTYDGTQNSVELVLKGEKTHTEFRSEARQSICYRTVTTYRTVCHGGYPGNYPGNYPGRYPHPGRSCYTQPYHTQVAYSCTQMVQVPFEVKDYDTQANVIVDVANLSGVATSGEKFVVTLNGETLSIQAVGSKAFLLMLKKQDQRTSMNGSVKMIDGLYAIEMIEAAPVLKAFKMSDITLQKRVLKFNMGPVVDASNIAFSLNVTKKRTLGSDDVLFNRELASSEILLNSESTGSAAAVDVQALGVTLKEGKYTLTAKAYFKGAGSLLNKSQFGSDLDASRTLIYKIK